MDTEVLYVRRRGCDRTVEQRLEAAGFAVRTAATTSEARERVAAGDVDCVVSRYEVPRPDGLEFGGGIAVLEAIREVNDEIPFVLFTRVLNRDVVHGTAEHDVSDYVRHCDERSFDRLIARVESAAEGYRARRRVRQLSRINELIRDVNARLVRSGTRAEIFEAVTSELTRLDAYGFAWLGDADGPECYAAAGPEAGTDAEEGLVEPVVADVDGETVVRRVGDGPEWATAREAGYAVALATRIVREEAHATLVLFAERPEAFDETERAVVEELADTVDYALEAVRTRSELERRERELKRKNERLENFASMVSHDLRNPLQAASGHLELAEADDAGHVDRAAESLHRMATIIDNILALAREQGLEVEAETVDLAAAAREAWANEHTDDATLRVEVEGAVVADRTYLRQILENLFRNAIEHAGRDATVRVTEREAGFAVCDDGPGVPEADRERVFRMGVTGDDAGTGFGLAIVREMAEAHGWSVAVEDCEDGGACFAFEGVERAG